MLLAIMVYGDDARCLCGSLAYCLYRYLLHASSHRKDSLSCHYKQGRLLDVKHDARCVTGKVGERRKPEEGRILIYYYINIT